MNFSSLLSDPVETLMSLLTALPGILLALSVHEAAHGWVANRCGDPTARMMGRISLNPARHIDPVGFLCMLFVGFGWAKPVPVNPIFYKNYRKDDLKVSLAGIAANLLMFLISFAILMSITTGLYAKIPQFDSFDEYVAYVDESGYVRDDGRAAVGFSAAYAEDGEIFVCAYDENDLVYEAIGNKLTGEGRSFYYHFTEEQLFKEYNVVGGYYLASVAGGRMAEIAYKMLLSFALLNIGLAVFNLIPLPPLDGYHVLNDLILKRPLFADLKAQRIGTGLLFALIMLGNVDPKLDLISIALNGVRNGVTGFFANGWYALMHIINII